MLHAAERTLARPKQDEPASGDEARQTRIPKLAEALRRLDERPKLVVATKMARELLPGDSEFGDPLSTAGSEPSQQLGKRMSALTAERPSLLGEVGLSALQVWQSISQQQSGEIGEREMAILFTDLLGEGVKLKRRRGFRAKGAPKELQVYAVRK